MSKRTGDFVQLAGLVITGSGIGIELAAGESWGLLIITIGSIAFAIGTKMKGR